MCIPSLADMHTLFTGSIMTHTHTSWPPALAAVPLDQVNVRDSILTLCYEADDDIYCKFPHFGFGHSGHTCQLAELM